MAKNKSYTGGKHAIGKPTLNKESMFQLIKKCKKANEQARGAHEYESIMQKYWAVRP